VLLACGQLQPDICPGRPYRTDLAASQRTRGGGRASSLGLPGAMLANRSPAALCWPVGFGWAGGLPGRRRPDAGRGAFTLARPRLAPIVHPVTSLRQAVVGGRRKNFCAAQAAAGRC